MLYPVLFTHPYYTDRADRKHAGWCLLTNHSTLGLKVTGAKTDLSDRGRKEAL